MRIGICERGWRRGDTSVSRIVEELLAIAQQIEGMGFGRLWLTEHHLDPTAWTVPDSLVSLVGACTHRLTIGIGGILIASRNPYRTALDLALLASAFPGRLDYGLGRSAPRGNHRCLAGDDAPVADPAYTDLYVTRAATLLRCMGIRIDGPASESAHHDEFSLQPQPTALLPPWLLGTSTNSMRLAAEWGLPFACVHNRDAPAVVAEYRRTFRPSAVLDKPRCMISLLGVFGRSAEHATDLMVRLPSGDGAGVAAVPVYSRQDAGNVFERVVDAYQPDELVYTDFCADPNERLETYSAIAEQVISRLFPTSTMKCATSGKNFLPLGVL
jgi:alkanesulfonate monooxygenase SsuD/methylene tetrahydromethanopterin reductase-like flavin-dependent oxidoreductase (luciferase family)